MRSFFAAISFLTVIPVPAGWCGEEKELGRSAPAFPFVGALIGGLAAAVAACCTKILPPLPSAVIIAASLSAISGGLHLDGLADTADGLFSARPRERALEIMRDSRIGTMGAVALFFILAAKVAGLASLKGTDIWRAVLLAPIGGRCAIVIMLNALPYARTSGLGTIFHRYRSPSDAVWAIAALAAAGWFIAGLPGLGAAIAVLAVSLLAIAYSRRRIGGYTGDTLGAVSETAEASALLFFASEMHVAPGA